MTVDINNGDTIIEAAIKVGSSKEISLITIDDIAKEADLSPSTIYKLFHSKSDLLLEAFFSIDKKTDFVFQTFEFDEKDLLSSVKNIWINYFKLLVSTETSTKYYLNYRSSEFYNVEIASRQVEIYPHFVGMVSKFEEILKTSKFSNYSTSEIWDFIITNTLTLAVKVIDKQVEYSEKHTDLMFDLIFKGLF